MSRPAALAGIAAALVLFAVPTGLAQSPPPATTYTDPARDAGTAPDVRSIAVAYYDGGASFFYDFDTTFATPFAGKARYGIYFDTDRNRKTGNTEGAEYRLRLFPDGDFSWARWMRDYGWVERDGSVTAGPQAPDGKSLDIAVDRADLGGAHAFNFYVISYDTATDDEDDAPNASSPTWSYPESAAQLHDQAAVYDGLLRQSDLHPGAWKAVPGPPGTWCGTQPTAIAARSFVRAGAPTMAAESTVSLYASSAQARRAFSTLRGCFQAEFAKLGYQDVDYSAYLGGLAVTLRQDGATYTTHYSWALAGRAIVCLTQNAAGTNVSFSKAREAALLRLMASRL